MTNDSEIRPFRIDIPQADLDDLRDRLGAHPLARAPLPGDDWDTGVPVALPARAGRLLARRLRLARARRRELNEFPQFTHRDRRAEHPLPARALARAGRAAAGPDPRLAGSVVEFLDVIGPLTDPRAHGGDPADAFHVVVPSLPGFGFSGPTRDRLGHQHGSPGRGPS